MILFNLIDVVKYLLNGLLNWLLLPFIIVIVIVVIIYWEFTFYPTLYKPKVLTCNGLKYSYPWRNFKTQNQNWPNGNRHSTCAALENTKVSISVKHSENQTARQKEPKSNHKDTTTFLLSLRLILLREVSSELSVN